MKPQHDLVVISSYPPQGQTHGLGTVGVASYAKNTLASFPTNLHILVLAEILPGQPPEYQENNITVIRCWQRNSLGAFTGILKNIPKYPQVPVLIEFEMAMFGNPGLNIFLPFLLLFLKLTHHPTTIVLHQIVLNFNEISGHIGQSKTSPVNTILNLLAKIFYRLVITLASNIIVFEQFLKDRLDKNNPKIIIIPHGVETSIDKTINFSEHKKISEVNEFTVTVFGFLAWYKGTDWIAKIFSNYFDHHPKSKYKLIIAGGPNPNHIDKPYYQKYLAEINQYCVKHPQKIILTGFVPEFQIINHYQNSDLILLPYRVGMSSSGPLSLAFTYHQPFMVSSPISPLFYTSDIKKIFQENKIDPKTITFNLNSPDFFRQLNFLKKQPQLLKTLSLISSQVYTTRRWSHINQAYLTCLGL